MRRAALLAGRWYPGDERSCLEAIERHADGAPRLPAGARGLVGPHAGWAYSGRCAARTYAALAEHRADVELVVVFGSHRGPHDPCTVFRGEAWETPIGALDTDRELADACAHELALGDEPIRPRHVDNAVELHLPFVRRFFPRARLLVIGVAASERALALGRAVGERVREAGRDAVFVGSTDLTHYGPNYAFAPMGGGEAAVRWVRTENDAGFLAALLRGDSRGVLAHALENRSACCPGAVAATLEAVRAYRRALAPALVEHTLSFDVRPDASFVGYGGALV
ncbi:MAG TPA: AmmeMemoRadiSam system protein B [Sandaracinaceae bacterium]